MRSLYRETDEYEDDRYDQLAEQELTRYLLRDPRLAAFLSALVMGLGQLFNAQYKRAFVFFGGEVAVFLYLWDYASGLTVSQTLVGLTSPGLYRVFLWMLTFGGIALWVYNIRDAYRMAEFCQFIYDRAFPLLDEEESEIVARHLTINRGGLTYHRGMSTKAVFLVCGILLYSAALIALGAFYLGRKDQVQLAAVVPSKRIVDSTAPVDPMDPKARLKAGEAAFDAGNMELAEREFERLLAMDPPPRLRYQALVDLGRVASARGDDARASDLLLKAVALSKEITTSQAPSRESPIGRASEALEKGDAATAEKLLNPVAADSQSWLLLAKAAAAHKEWDRARGLLTNYVAKPNPDPEAWLELARAELKTGHRNDAIQHAERYLRVKPGDPEASLVRAAALEAEKGPQAAYAAVEEALAAHPGDTRLLAEAMQLAEGAGNMEQALQAARALLKVDPGNKRAKAIVEAGTVAPHPEERDPSQPDVGAELYKEQQDAKPAKESAPEKRSEVPIEKYAELLRDAELAYSAGEKGKALSLYEKVLKVRPDHPRSLYQKGILLREKKESRAAVAAFEAALQARPSDLPTLNELGQLYMEFNSLDKARDVFQQVVALDSKHLAARYQLAEIFERKDNLAGAEDQYRAILRHYPELTEAYDYLGNLYYRQNKFQEALEQFQKLMSLSQNDPTVRFKIGLVYYRMNRPERALEHFKALKAEINPQNRLYPQVQKYLAKLERGEE